MKYRTPAAAVWSATQASISIGIHARIRGSTGNGKNRTAAWLRWCWLRTICAWVSTVTAVLPISSLNFLASINLLASKEGANGSAFHAACSVCLTWSTTLKTHGGVGRWCKRYQFRSKVWLVLYHCAGWRRTCCNPCCKRCSDCCVLGLWRPVQRVHQKWTGTKLQCEASSLHQWFGNFGHRTMQILAV